MHRINKGDRSETKIGDVVLIKEDNVHRGNWRMCVVSDLITGKDRVTRGAKVRIGGTLLGMLLGLRALQLRIQYGKRV